MVLHKICRSAHRVRAQETHESSLLYLAGGVGVPSISPLQQQDITSCTRRDAYQLMTLHVGSPHVVCVRCRVTRGRDASRGTLKNER